jgi:GDSL-like Lipase/Acylhydrolase family
MKQWIRLTPALAMVCAVATAGGLAPFAFGADAPSSAKPRVLILGDSISIGYTPIVREMLKDEAVVVRPTLRSNPGRAENCEGTTLGVKAVDRWLQLDGGHWDVIHFNFGLHDLKHVNPATRANSNNAKDPRQAEPEVYEKQLREIVGKLKRTKAKLIFAATTPVPAGGVKPYRDVLDPLRYNEIAFRVMSENGIVVNDLYSVILPRLWECQLPVNVHFTKEGYRVLAEAVVREVRGALHSKAGP